MKKTPFIQSNLNKFKRACKAILIGTGSLLFVSFAPNNPACLFSNNNAPGKLLNEDPVVESKVDYLEKIYFSGQNKEGLGNLILGTIQGMEGKSSTTSVASQYAFLTGVRGRIEAAKNSCEAQEMIAAGIYNLDINEAMKQGIEKPSAKISGELSAVLSTSRSVSSNATNLSYDAWVLSNGNVSGYNTMSKVANVANAVNRAGTTYEDGKKAFETGKQLGQKLGLFKDKPCSKVAQKDIQLTDHVIHAPDSSKP